MTEGQHLPKTYEVKDWIESMKGRMITTCIARKPIFEVKQAGPPTRHDSTQDLHKARRNIKN